MAWGEENVLPRFDDLMARIADQNASVSDEEFRADIEAAREALAR